MSDLVIIANDPSEAVDFVAAHLRDLASKRRRQSMLAGTKREKRSHERLADDLEMVARQIETADIRSEDCSGDLFA